MKPNYYESYKRIALQAADAYLQGSIVLAKELTLQALDLWKKVYYKS